MILFLDFDGVLHPFDRPSSLFVLLPDFERVMRDFSGVDIVISSTWREAHTLAQLRSFFSPDMRQRIIDATPIFTDLALPYVREAEITAWLKEVGRESESWVALDDTAWFFSPGCPHLLLVDPATGFDDRTGWELRRRLTG